MVAVWGNHLIEPSPLSRTGIVWSTKNGTIGEDEVTGVSSEADSEADDVFSKARRRFGETLSATPLQT